ncbi:MAG: heme NO-binding domain-containing protein [Rhizobiaceae bacterium]
MLGIVFSEFIDLVEGNFSEEIVDELLDFADENFESEGAYTVNGDYDHNEMLILVGKLSERTGVPVQDLVYTYGEQLFGKFHTKYPMFFDGIEDSLTFLSGVETRIHTEVRKLYTNSQLPWFNCEFTDEDTLEMVYKSERPLASLAHGLIAGCISHFQDNIDLKRIDLDGDAMTSARFILKRSNTEAN